jgi:hypothetical protein
MDGGGCVFYYDALSQPDLVSGMMRSSFALERLAEAEVPPDQATASGSLQRLALYRVSRPNSCARGRACV